MIAENPDPPRESVWRALALAAVGGVAAAVVKEIGEGVREYLREKRAEKQEPKP